MDKAVQEYHQKVIEYESHLKDFIQQKYSLKINFLTLMNWGYTTTAYYMKTDKGNFVCRISKFSKDKEEGLTKDIQVSNILMDSYNIPAYINSNQGEYLLKYVDLMGQSQLLRISDHIEGVIGFNISIENVRDLALFLHKLHHELPNEQDIKLKELFKPNEGKFLHGDLTPTNCLISYGKVVRIVDFEHSFFGSIEYDLARTAVFCWFHLENLKFTEIEEILLSAYKTKDQIDTNILHDFAQNNIAKLIYNIKKHTQDYENEQKLNDELKFAMNMEKKLNIELSNN